MTKSITLSIVHCVETSNSEELPVFSVRVRGADLLPVIASGGFPLDANVRRPRKNHVVREISASIMKDPKHRIENPIFLSVRTLEYSAAEGCIIMQFAEFDGIVDGATRILGLSHSVETGVDIARVELTLVIFCNLSEDQLRKKAIDLNTSKPVDRSSKLEFKHAYDFIKPSLKDYEIFYKEGHYDPKYGSSKTAQLCGVVRVIYLLLLLDVTYNPRDFTYKKNHPYEESVKVKANRFQIKVQGYVGANLHLIPDVLRLQTMICREWERRFKNSKPSDELQIRFITEADPEKLIKLPTGDVLEINLPTSLLIAPQIAALRVFLNLNYKWCVGDFMEINAPKEVEKLVTWTIRILNNKEYKDIKHMERLNMEEEIWHKLWVNADNSRKSLMGTNHGYTPSSAR